jgi:hypothetical protein
MNNSAISDKNKLKKKLSLQFRAFADLVDTRGFLCWIRHPLQTITTGHVFIFLVFQVVRGKSYEQKKHFFSFYSRFFGQSQTVFKQQGLSSFPANQR